VIDVRNPERASDRSVRQALAETVDLVRSQLAEAPPEGASVPRSFLDAMERRHPGAIEDPAVSGNLIYLLHFTWSDFSGLLIWILRQLSEHPEWAGRLRRALAEERSADHTPTQLATRIVLETLRLEQSEHLYRVATRRIEHDGAVIPRGWLVRLCVRESHRDPQVFEEPDRFNPDRFLHRTYSRSEFSPFGLGGRHACLGEDLTRSVGATFVETLVGRLDWRTVADGELEYSAWRHWRPSSEWRIEAWPRE
jgi:cytochrome P450